MKKILTILISFITMCAVLSGCGSEEKYDETANVTKDDSAAIEIITLYENYCKGRNYHYKDYSSDAEMQFETTYYNIKPFIYGLMENRSPNEEKVVQYNIPDSDFISIADMFFVTDNPIVDIEDSADYESVLNTYDCQFYYGEKYVELTPISKTHYENGDIVYSFERKYENSVIGYVDYTLNEITAENVPDILNSLYKDGDIVYKIKSVEGSTDVEIQQKTLVEISSAQDLIEMSADYAVNGYKYGNHLYVLTNDIDMSGVTDFLPVGRNMGNNGDSRFDNINGFCSEFDGQGYTIKNLSLNENVPTKGYSSHKIALFDTISYRGIVKNVNVENININIPEQAEKEPGEYFSCAGFAVYISGTVDNCHVQGSIYNPAGGGGGFVNQIDGYNGTVISNCSADVDILGSWGMGGFAVNCLQEYSQKQDFFKLYNCSSFGSITAQRYDGMPSYYDVGEFGGFADKIYGGTFEKCHVQTPLIINTTAKYIGGFAANLEGDPLTQQQAEFIDCTYSPSAVGDKNIIGMISWKNTYGDYGDAEFTPLEK